MKKWLSFWMVLLGISSMTILTGCDDDEAVEPDQNAVEQDDSIVDDEDQDDNDDGEDTSGDENGEDNSSGEDDSSGGEDSEDGEAGSGEDDPDGDGNGDDNGEENSEDEDDGNVGEDGGDDTSGDDNGDEEEGEPGDGGTNDDNGSEEDGTGEEDEEGNGSGIAEEVAFLVAGTDSKTWQLEQYGMGGFAIPVERCRADDDWIFYKDGTFVIKDNALKCDAGEPDQVDGNWSVSEDGSTITLTYKDMSQEHIIEELSASHAVLVFDGITFIYRVKED